MAGGVGVLPQKAPDDLKPAQKLFELLGVDRHLEREGVAGGFEPLVHLAGQHQRRHGHEQNRRQHHRADVEVHSQSAEHDAAPEHDIEDGHIIVVVEGAQVGGQQGEIGCVALPLILGHRAAQHPLHDLSPYLLHGTAGEFCKGAAAQPFEKPAGEGDEEHQPHIAQRLLLALGVDEPLELEAFQRREKGYHRRKEHKDDELRPVVLEVVVDRLIIHKQYPLYVPKGFLPRCRIWTKYNMVPQKKIGFAIFSGHKNPPARCGQGDKSSLCKRCCQLTAGDRRRPEPCRARCPRTLRSS